MPIYEYRCEQGHTFDVLQRMSDDPVEHCTTCEAPVRRVFTPVAIHFKGSGFHNTDYGKGRRGGGDGEGGDGDSSATDKGSDAATPSSADGKGSAGESKPSADSKSSGDSKGSGGSGASKAASTGSSGC